MRVAPVPLRHGFGRLAYAVAAFLNCLLNGLSHSFSAAPEFRHPFGGGQGSLTLSFEIGVTNMASGTFIYGFFTRRSTLFLNPRTVASKSCSDSR